MGKTWVPFGINVVANVSRLAPQCTSPERQRPKRLKPHCNSTSGMSKIGAKRVQHRRTVRSYGKPCVTFCVNNFFQCVYVSAYGMCTSVSCPLMYTSVENWYSLCGKFFLCKTQRNGFHWITLRLCCTHLAPIFDIPEVELQCSFSLFGRCLSADVHCGANVKSISKIFTQKRDAIFSHLLVCASFAHVCHPFSIHRK